MIIIIRKKIQLVESLLENSGLKDLLLKVKTISDETFIRPLLLLPWFMGLIRKSTLDLQNGGL